MDKVISILRKEFALVSRSSSGVVSLFVLVLSMIFIFHYSLERNTKLTLESLLGLRWAILFVVAFVFIGQSTWEEREGGASRVNETFLSPTIYFLTKSFVIFLVMVLLEIVEMLLFSVFFEEFPLNKKSVLGQILFLTPGTLALSFLGVSLSLVSVASRMGEMLLPLLLIPFSIPLFLFGMGAERKFWSATSVWDWSSFGILLILCILYGALGAMLQELASEDF